MAEQATYIGIQPRSVKANGTTGMIRGTRVNLQTDNTAIVADATTRGQFVCITNSDPATHCVAASIQAGEKVPALAYGAITTAVGDAAYSAAGGAFTNVSTSAILMGRWMTITTGGTLGVVELFNPA